MMSEEARTELVFDFLLEEYREELEDLIAYQHHDEAVVMLKDYCYNRFLTRGYSVANSFIRYIFEDVDWEKLTFDLQDCF